LSGRHTIIFPADHSFVYARSYFLLNSWYPWRQVLASWKALTLF